MQLYADLAVLSARPSAGEMADAPHHLYGVADALEAWSVGRWLSAARGALDAIAARSRPAVVVGGTGLYFTALTAGLADIPAVPLAVRDAASVRFDADGEARFRATLAERDADSARRIYPGDRQRLIRAFSVVEATGVPLPVWQAKVSDVALPPHAWAGVVLEPDRSALYARCDARLRAIAADGAMAEVAALLARRPSATLPIMKALGVREFASAVEGRATLEQALAAAQMQTRRYAKRQSTWFRNQTPDWPRIETLDPEARWEALQALVSKRSA